MSLICISLDRAEAKGNSLLVCDGRGVRHGIFLKNPKIY